MSLRSLLDRRVGLLPTSAMILLSTQVVACGPVVGWPTPCDDCDSDSDSDTAVGAAPLVESTLPENNAFSVARQMPVIVIFDSWMDPATLTVDTITLEGPSGAVSGTVAHTADSAYFYPNASLDQDAGYTATVTTGVENMDGVAMEAPYTWTFNTGGLVDTSPPYVILTTPNDQATSVDLTTQVSATFSEAMDPAFMDVSTFQLVGPDGEGVTGTVDFEESENRVNLWPENELMPDSVYGARITSEVRDVAGNTMSQDYVWVFTTDSIDWPLDPVELRSLDTFVALAATGLSNSNSNGTTTLNGDLGLSPDPSCIADGAPCTSTNPVVNGYTYAADAEGLAAQAQGDLLVAHADGMARPSGTLVQDLTDMTLPPGVYTSAASMRIDVGGTVVLDAEGDPNAVWIFQIGVSLTVEDDAQVLLINGAKAQNVFWVVGTSATIGAEVNFQGNVMSGISNEMGPGSALVGRLLASTGSVSLLSNSITLPSP